MALSVDLIRRSINSFHLQTSRVRWVACTYSQFGCSSHILLQHKQLLFTFHVNRDLCSKHLLAFRWQHILFCNLQISVRMSPTPYRCLSAPRTDSNSKQCEEKVHTSKWSTTVTHPLPNLPRLPESSRADFCSIWECYKAIDTRGQGKLMELLLDSLWLTISLLV